MIFVDVGNAVIAMNATNESGILCQILHNTSDILDIVENLKCECDLKPVIDAIKELDKKIDKIQAEFKCEK